MSIENSNKTVARNEMEGFLLGVFAWMFLQIYGKARQCLNPPYRPARKI